MQRLLRLFIISSLYLISNSAYSSVTEEVKSVDGNFSEKRVKLYSTASYTSLTSSTSSAHLDMLGLHLNVSFALSSKFALSMGYETNYSERGFGLASAFSSGLTYAITGSLIGHESSYKVDGEEILQSIDSSESGFRMQLLLVQYYINGSTSSVPLNGVGVSGCYEFVTDGAFVWHLGVRVDTIANEGISSTPVLMFSGISLWF